MPYRTTINKNGRQIVVATGMAITPRWFMPAVTRRYMATALDTTLNGGNQYVHNGRYIRLNTVVNE